MKAMIEQPTRGRGVRCAVCETHSRPVYVPWEQHTVGCAIRATELGRTGPQPRRAVSIVAGALHL